MAIVAVPNDFTRGQLEGRLRAQVEDSLSEGLGREVRIMVTVDPSAGAGRGSARSRRTRGRPDGSSPVRSG